jgi:hypothetical protein
MQFVCSRYATKHTSESCYRKLVNSSFISLHYVLRDMLNARCPMHLKFSRASIALHPNTASSIHHQTRRTAWRWKAFDVLFTESCSAVEAVVCISSYGALSATACVFLVSVLDKLNCKNEPQLGHVLWMTLCKWSPQPPLTPPARPRLTVLH